jgi:hypothetical protein
MKHHSFITGWNQEKGSQGETGDQATPDTATVQSVAALEQRLHELQIRQRELELENEQLRESRAGLETALACCVERYDFAPVGYFSLDRDGVMTNITWSAPACWDRSVLASMDSVS